MTTDQIDKKRALRIPAERMEGLKLDAHQLTARAVAPIERILDDIIREDCGDSPLMVIGPEVDAFIEAAVKVMSRNIDTKIAEIEVLRCGLPRKHPARLKLTALMRLLLRSDVLTENFWESTEERHLANES